MSSYGLFQQEVVLVTSPNDEWLHEMRIEGFFLPDCVGVVTPHLEVGSWFLIGQNYECAGRKLFAWLEKVSFICLILFQRFVRRVSTRPQFGLR